MVVAVFGYSAWGILLVGLTQGLAQEDAPLSMYIWMTLTSMLWFALLTDAGRLRQRLPIKPTWLRVLVWGTSIPLVLGVALVSLIPESEAYRLKAANRSEEARKKASASEKARLEQAQAEAKQAQAEADRANAEAKQAKEDADRANAEAQKAKAAAERAKADAASAAAEATKVRSQTATPAPAEQWASSDVKMTSTTPVPNKDRLRAIVVNTLGERTNSKKDRIVELNATPTVTADGKVNGYVAAITLNADENLTTSWTRDGLFVDSKKLLQALYTDSQLQDLLLEWHLPLRDVYGNTKDGRVMRFRIDGSTASRINWSDFLAKNIPVVTRDYQEHPALTKK